VRGFRLVVRRARIANRSARELERRRWACLGFGTGRCKSCRR
jgi:hypothetical protein